MKKNQARASRKSAVTQPKTTPETPLCNPPFVPGDCLIVSEWESNDKSWEQLLFDSRTRTFYMHRSDSETANITIADALNWYGQRRAMECDYGDLSWPNLKCLIQEAVWTLRKCGEQKREPLPTLADLDAARKNFGPQVPEGHSMVIPFDLPGHNEYTILSRKGSNYYIDEKHVTLKQAFLWYAECERDLDGGAGTPEEVGKFLAACDKRMK